MLITMGGSNHWQTSGRGGSQPLSSSPLPGLSAAAGKRCPVPSLLMPPRSRAGQHPLRAWQGPCPAGFLCYAKRHHPDKAVMDSCNKAAAAFGFCSGISRPCRAHFRVYLTLLSHKEVATADSNEQAGQRYDPGMIGDLGSVVLGHRMRQSLVQTQDHRIGAGRTRRDHHIQLLALQSHPNNP